MGSRPIGVLEIGVSSVLELSVNASPSMLTPPKLSPRSSFGLGKETQKRWFAHKKDSSRLSDIFYARMGVSLSFLSVPWLISFSSPLSSPLLAWEGRASVRLRNLASRSMRRCVDGLQRQGEPDVRRRLQEPRIAQGERSSCGSGGARQRKGGGRRRRWFC